MPSTLASAANLDRAFAAADGFAMLPRSELNTSQQQFLASAASIQRIGDYAQAAATLDSLSGQAHATGQGLLLEQATAHSTQLRTHLDRMRPGMRAGAWTQRAHAGGGVSGSGSIDARYDIGGQVSGFDQWLGDGWLLGSSVGWGSTGMQFERLGGVAHGDAPMASVYLHHRGRDDMYFTGLVGYGRTTLMLDRPLDFGAAGRPPGAFRTRRVAGVCPCGSGTCLRRGGRTFDAVRFTRLVDVERGRLRRTGQQWIRTGGAVFERSASSAAAVGMRYLRDWRFDNGGWMQLDLSGQYRQVFAREGDPIRAAFVGAPMAGFQIEGLPFDDGHGVFGFALTGGKRDARRWFLQYDKAFTGNTRGDAWWAGLRIGF